MKTNPVGSKKCYSGVKWVINFSDEDIKVAAKNLSSDHEDAPTTREICDLASGLPWPACEMLDLNWLRNRYVGLRKAGFFK